MVVIAESLKFNKLELIKEESIVCGSRGITALSFSDAEALSVMARLRDAGEALELLEGSRNGTAFELVKPFLDALSKLDRWLASPISVVPFSVFAQVAGQVGNYSV
jgi:hypothetical protein